MKVVTPQAIQSGSLGWVWKELLQQQQLLRYFKPLLMRRGLYNCKKNNGKDKTIEGKKHKIINGEFEQVIVLHFQIHINDAMEVYMCLRKDNIYLYVYSQTVIYSFQIGR